MSAESPQRASTRYRSLDGLRGLAAAVVVLHHCLLTVPVLSAPYFQDQIVGDPSSRAWWLIYSPLHLLWDGTAAVYVFFVLSGIVLTLPVLRARPFSWRAYYPQRLIRLYAPVWAAVALAVVNIVLIPRGPAGSQWLSSNVDPINRPAVLNDLGLLTGHGNLMSPLWSLHWEVLFSILLPVFAWVAIRFGRFGLLLVPLAAVCNVVGALAGIRELEFLPMFLIGTVLALRLDEIDRLVRGLSIRARTIVTALALVSVSAPWYARAFGVPSHFAVAFEPLSLLGAAALVVAAIHTPALRRLLESKALQFLGSISFSWYLVHEPIVIGFAYLTGTQKPWAAIPLALGVSIGTAYLFQSVVERPSHRLARLVGARALPPRALLQSEPRGTAA